MKVIRVGLDVPVARLFDYCAGDATVADIGTRVVVPLGARKAVGVIVEVADTSSIPQDQLKSAHAVLRDGAAFSADDMRLLRFASDYYHYPLGQVLLAALPLRLRRVKAPRARKTTAPAAEPSPASALNAEVTTEQRVLTRHQAAAVTAISARLDDFRPFLLYGVTGSGKTEVYLELVERILASERQVLMLVPEIALTPQLEAMVQARFPDVPLVSLHSGLNETARIVLGTRLAVFTPLPRLGLIVVDEEQDGSFKQTEGFCYSARDLAVVRASQRGVPIVLGSATPSLETYQNAQSG